VIRYDPHALFQIEILDASQTSGDLEVLKHLSLEVPNVAA